MNRASLVLAAVALGGSLGGLPLAQRAGFAAETVAEPEMPAGQLVGKPVYNDQGQNIGTIAEVLVDTHSGQSSLVLSVGKFLGVGVKYVVVPVDRVTLGDKRMIMAGATQERLANMDSFLLERIERDEHN